MDETQANGVLEPGDERQKYIDRCSAAIGAFAEVRDLVLQPGWATLILELQREAVIARQAVDDALDGILIKRTSEREQEFTEAKIKLLALEEALQLYLKMRDRARTAKDDLDKMPLQTAL